ncbi:MULTISPECIES: Maf family protein [Lysinibacillus]|jgi:septum formation protein|uniref:dTTP/UTP pyrophosphatase n=1 Tax=Lysinibacillus fusiformis TaxID=28031 RepID=A0A2I0V1N8_9BACI|nr:MULTISPECIES: Maf family protein [Lysinibacillus]KUF29955.1 septum formation inhibitor Maf [Lysinibacillus sp. F5]MEE3805682.1 Maf family protein [Lysinibacillus fusiformis]PKU52176.1 septum formation protein Maf [Lysinibacillus fusiformis]WCH46612.1 Maf family protein [Lysinibacillus sp. OF-1]
MLKTNYKLVLASASPRRKELLGMLALPFEVMTSEVEETSVQANTMQDYVKGVALLKTRDVARKAPNATIIGADTIVVYKDELLHKPKTREEAISHLQRLSDNKHVVMTAVAIIEPNGKETIFVEETTVIFHHLSQELIEAYVDSGDPFDKAGGYGIQTVGTLLVKRIEGDYNNVVGLPLAALFSQLVARQIIQFAKE